MGHYQLTEDAEADIIRIYCYGVAYFGEARAEAYYDALYGRFAQIAKNPYMYPAIDEIQHGYRRSLCGQENIYYRIIDETMIEIVRILSKQPLPSMDAL